MVYNCFFHRDLFSSNFCGIPLRNERVVEITEDVGYLMSRRESLSGASISCAAGIPQNGGIGKHQHQEARSNIQYYDPFLT
jgi:hypothetical protein